MYFHQMLAFVHYKTTTTRVNPVSLRGYFGTLIHYISERKIRKFLGPPQQETASAQPTVNRKICTEDVSTSVPENRIRFGPTRSSAMSAKSLLFNTSRRLPWVRITKPVITQLDKYYINNYADIII